MNQNGDVGQRMEPQLRRLILIINCINCIMFVGSLTILLWIFYYNMFHEPDLIRCELRNSRCARSNRIWKCSDNGTISFHANGLVPLKTRSDCLITYKYLDDLYKCNPKSACSWKTFSLINGSLIELLFSWFVVTSLLSYFKVDNFNISQAKKVATIIKFITGFLAIKSMFLYRIHKVIPIAIPLKSLFYMGEKFTASLISNIIIFIKYFGFVSTVLLDNRLKTRY